MVRRLRGRVSFAVVSLWSLIGALSVSVVPLVSAQCFKVPRVASFESRKKTGLTSTEAGVGLVVGHRATSRGLLGGFFQVKSGITPPGYMDQAPSRGHEASPQSGLGAG